MATTFRGRTNCIIPSIDGLTKDVLEAIRPRTNFERTYKNAALLIKEINLTQTVKYTRMVRQQLNYQWEDYNIYWNKILDRNKGDDILGVDVHNTGGKVKNFDKMRVDTYNHEKEHEEHFTEQVNKGNFKKITTPKNADGKVYVKAHEVEEIVVVLIYLVD